MRGGLSTPESLSLSSGRFGGRRTTRRAFGTSTRGQSHGTWALPPPRNTDSSQPCLRSGDRASGRGSGRQSVDSSQDVHTGQRGKRALGPGGQGAERRRGFCLSGGVGPPHPLTALTLVISRGALGRGLARDPGSAGRCLHSTAAMCQVLSSESVGGPGGTASLGIPDLLSSGSGPLSSLVRPMHVSSNTAMHFTPGPLNPLFPLPGRPHPAPFPGKPYSFFQTRVGRVASCLQLALVIPAREVCICSSACLCPEWKWWCNLFVQGILGHFG